MEKIQVTDVNALAEKLSKLELTEGEAHTLRALIDAAAGDEVTGFALQRMQQTAAGLQRMQQTVTGPRSCER